jgi:hypothetical protein
LASQDIAALDPVTRGAVFGSSKTIICFQLGREDADYMAPHFNDQFREFNPYALRHLNVGEAYWSGGFLYPEKDIRPRSDPELVRRQSVMHYGRERAMVERGILRAINVDKSDRK